MPVTCKQCSAPLENRRRAYCSVACFHASEADYQKRARLKWSAFKRRASGLVFEAVLKGDLVRQPCETCGDKFTVAHHDDYAKPLDVRWLCRNHHAQHHRDHGPGANAFAKAESRQ